MFIIEKYLFRLNKLQRKLDAQIKEKSVTRKIQQKHHLFLENKTTSARTTANIKTPHEAQSNKRKARQS